MAERGFQQKGKGNWDRSNSPKVLNVDWRKSIHHLRGKVTMLPTIGCSLIRTFMADAIKDAAIGVGYSPLLAGNSTQVHSLICTCGSEASKRRTAMPFCEQAQRTELDEERGADEIVAFVAHLGGIQSTQHLTLRPNTEGAVFFFNAFLVGIKEECRRYFNYYRIWQQEALIAP